MMRTAYLKGAHRTSRAERGGDGRTPAMTRLPRLVLVVLLAVSGCRGLRGCGASEPPAVVSAPQPVVSASPAVVSAPKPEVSTSVEAPPPPEAPYEKAWLVAYVKNAGALDPERERKVPLCRAQAELDARARAEAWEGMPLLVENVSGATVMGATATATAPRGGEGPCLLPRGAPCAPHGGSHLHGGGLLGV
jgi:hypothetical protein